MDTEENEYLTSENAEAESACVIEEFPLPHKPTMKARVKQLPIGELRRLHRAAQRGTPMEQEKAEIEMIQKSIVNADGTPVYSEERLKALKSCNQPLMNSLAKVIGLANNKTPKQVNEEIDDLEKN